MRVPVIGCLIAALAVATAAAAPGQPVRLEALADCQIGNFGAMGGTIGASAHLLVRPANECACASIEPLEFVVPLFIWNYLAPPGWHGWDGSQGSITAHVALREALLTPFGYRMGDVICEPAPRVIPTPVVCPGCVTTDNAFITWTAACPEYHCLTGSDRYFLEAWTEGGYNAYTIVSSAELTIEPEGAVRLGMRADCCRRVVTGVPDGDEAVATWGVLKQAYR